MTSALKGCPWPDFWDGSGNTDAAAAVASAQAGRSARFRGAANTAKGTPRYWDVQVSPIMGADGKPAQILSISRDITEECASLERERFFTEELAHRAKNSFAMVVAIARQTFRDAVHAASLETFVSRVLTLSRAHDFAKETNWVNTPLGPVLESALLSHRGGEGRFRIEGPAVKIAPKQALALTLAVNELATNAVKYGALSSPGGHVDIAWSATAGTTPMFKFIWREQGGAAISKPERQGFGSRVIKEFLANDFGGSVTLNFDPAGLVCELTAPLGNLPV